MPVISPVVLTPSEEHPWQKLFACCTTIRSTAIPSPMPATTFPSSSAIPTARRCRRRKAIDFKPGQLLGSVSGELGLRKFLEGLGHTLVVTSDKDGAGLARSKGAARRRNRHLAAVLAGLPDGRADRQGAQAEAGHHRRHRLRPRRSAGRHRPQASPSPKSPTATASASPSTS